MTNHVPDPPDPAADEARLARRLRELDECRKSGGRPVVDVNPLDDLTPSEIEELRGAAECLEQLDLLGPQFLLETARSRETAVALETAGSEAPAERKKGTKENYQSAPLQYIGRYEIIRRLGAGGFGVVFLARDPQLDREVALKVLKPEAIVSDSARKRFLREAHAAAVLSHPAIVPIFEAEQAGPVGYIAFELCHGQTLEQWLNDQTQPVDQKLACQIVQHLAEAVQHAHSRGVIHRDLKPGNVILKSKAETGSHSRLDVSSLRVTDFGLAQLESVDGTSLTQTGAPLGTPAYMSPEQARGTTKLMAGSDIYSLGVIFYQLITGRVPFSYESNFETLQSIINDEPLSPLRLNSVIDRDVAAICLKCLEKDPTQRYESCQALEDDLRNYLAGRPIQARTISSLDRFQRWYFRNPIVATSLSLLAASLIIGASVSSYYWWHAEQARSALSTQKARADLKADEALTQARLARSAVEDLQKAIANEPRIREKGMQSFRRLLLDSASKYYASISSQAPDDDEVLREHLATLDQLAGLHADLGDFDHAIDIWYGVIELIQSRLPDEAESLVSLRDRMTETLTNAARHDEALLNSLANIQWLQRLGDRKGASASLSLANSLRIRASAQSRQGDNLAAATTLDEALEVVVEATGQPVDRWKADWTLAKLLQAKAEVSLQLLKHDDVDGFAPPAITMLDQLFENDQSDEAAYLTSVSALKDLLGTSHAMRGQFDDAMVCFEAESGFNCRLFILQPEIAANAGRQTHLLHRMANTLYLSGKIDEAQKLLTEELPAVIKLREKFPELEILTEKIVLCFQILGKTYRRQGDLDPALDNLQKAIDICDEHAEQEQVSLVIQNHLGSLYLEKASYLLEQHKLEDAAEQCERALKVLEPIFKQQPAGEIAGMLEFAYGLTGNIFNRINRELDFLQLTGRLTDWNRNTPSVVKAKCHRVIALAHLSQWDQAETELTILIEAVSQGRPLLDVAGVCFQCATMIERNGQAGDPRFGRFVDQGLVVFNQIIESALANDPDVVKLLREHNDFKSLREQALYIEHFEE